MLLTGNVVSAVFSLATVVLMTRALSLEDFGYYALLVALVALIDRLVNFQSWQALIHFGMIADRDGDKDKLISLFAFGWRLDVITGLAGYVIVLLFSLLAPQWFGLGEDAFSLVLIAGMPILFNWTATPTAILRLFDRFDLQALYQNIRSGLMLAFTFGLWFFDQKTILFYIIAATFSDLAGKAFLYRWSFRELHQQQLLKTEKIDIRSLIETTPSLWRFLITTNLDGVVRVLRDVDIFIVNALLGPANVALYKVARTVTKVFGQATGPFYQAVFPEMSRLHAANQMGCFATLLKKSATYIGLPIFVAWLIYLVLGPKILEYGLGEGYIDAFGVSALCVAAMVVWSVALPLSSAMIALGQVEKSLIIHISTTSIYLLTLYIFTNTMNLLGSGLALLTFYVLWSAAMFLSVRYYLSQNLKSSDGHRYE